MALMCINAAKHRFFLALPADCLQASTVHTAALLRSKLLMPEIEPLCGVWLQEETKGRLQGQRSKHDILRRPTSAVPFLSLSICEIDGTDAGHQHARDGWFGGRLEDPTAGGPL